MPSSPRPSAVAPRDGRRRSAGSARPRDAKRDVRPRAAATRGHGRHPPSGRQHQGGRFMRIWVSAFAVLGVVGAAGCVYSPNDGDSRCPGTPFRIDGFASAPGATLTVEAFNDDTDVWEAVT